MITASDAVKAINEVRGEALVVGTMTPNRYWESVSTRRDLDLPVFGGMGKASSVALGLALAQPDKKVVILDGEGGLLMNLGSLVTIAGMEPKNLVHIVFDDGVYFTTGSQPVPGVGKYDLAVIAKGSGIEESHQFDNLEDFVSELPALMQKTGPVFIQLKIVHGDDSPEFYMGSTRDAMKRLSQKLREG
jgi:phosphonopyruvate decarboxylase